MFVLNFCNDQMFVLMCDALRSHIRSLVHFVVAVVCFCSFVVEPQRGTADAEIKVSPAENQERLKVLPLKPGVGKNRDMSTSPTARNFFLSDFYTTSGPFKKLFFPQTSP